MNGHISAHMSTFISAHMSANIMIMLGIIIVGITRVQILIKLHLNLHLM